MLREYADYPLGYGQVVNINFPGCEISECKGIVRNAVTSHSSFYHDHYNVVTELDNGGIRYMVEGDLNLESEPGTDFKALIDKYISVGIVNNVG